MVVIFFSVIPAGLIPGIQNEVRKTKGQKKMSLFFLGPITLMEEGGLDNDLFFLKRRSFLPFLFVAYVFFIVILHGKGQTFFFCLFFCAATAFCKLPKVIEDFFLTSERKGGWL